VGLLFGALPAIAQPTPESTADSAVARALADLHTRINEHRSSAGCPPLRWHEGAARVAEAHSMDMARRDYFDHRTPEGIDLSHRLLSGGVAWTGSIAENIALTVRGPDTVIELWVSSPPHRANLEHCSFTHHGLGWFRDRWTEVLLENPLE
jgi:uncharacterized protein YkwD